ncbi:hypothetical protein ACH5RR_013991 [Cinchona calisaya]|uniref:ACB domain-containing protein n=1 Tax=Cinchona calisaya TaxID=153742 RepID=A0ABD3A316_9GENT
MEVGFFQDLAFTVSLTVIVYLILSKLFWVFAEDVSNATYSSRTDGFVDKAGFFEHIGEEGSLGISGLQVVDDDHEGKKELEVEKGGGFVEDVLVEELKGEKDCVGVGGGEDIEEKEVDEFTEIRPIFQEIKEEKESPVEISCVELSLREEFEARECKNEGICEVLEGEETGTNAVQRTENDQEKGEESAEGGLFDDWEGIERTDLEKRFDAAVAFVGSKTNAHYIDGNLRMQFYALQRVANEGPCRGPQPMVFKVSARAKWNAWQKLGNMSTNMAMEQYVALLSESIPGWEDKQ